MDRLVLLAMADNSTNNCSTSNAWVKTPVLGIKNVQQNCNMTYDQAIVKYFNSTCKGNKACSIPFDKRTFPASCRGFSQFIGINCIGTEITIIDTDDYHLSVSRSDLTIIVIAFDILVCVTFVILSGMMMGWIEEEAIVNDIDYIQTTDFAIRIKNLPPLSEYKDLE